PPAPLLASPRSRAALPPRRPGGGAFGPPRGPGNRRGSPGRARAVARGEGAAVPGRPGPARGPEASPLDGLLPGTPPRGGPASLGPGARRPVGPRGPREGRGGGPLLGRRAGDRGPGAPAGPPRGAAGGPGR